MAKGLAQRLSGFGNTIGEKLFGTQQMTVQPGGQYPQELQDYLDDFENQQYVKELLNKPAHERMTLDQLKEGFTQGLNFGSQDMADAQKKLNINIPKTGEEINLAQTGDFNTYPLQSTLVAGERQGGFFNDLAKGYNENYSQKFDFDNLKPQNKNFATKTGEFLGSVGRFVDSPLGRGLLAAGLNKALGYDDSLQEGLTAYVGRQNAQTQDNLFRKSLMDDYGFAPEELSQIKGNISKDLYNTIAANRYKQQSMQLKRELSEAKDNVSRARMISTMLNNGSITPQEAQLRMAEYGITLQDIQESNNTKLLPYKQQAYIFGPQMAMANYGLARDKFNYQIQQDAMDNYFKMQGLNQGKPLSDTQVNKINDIDQAIEEMNGVINKYSSPSKDGVFGFSGYARRNPVSSGFDKEISELKQDIDLFRKTVARAKEGGRLTDQDQKYYEKALLNPNLTRTQFIDLAKQYQKKQLNSRNLILNNYSKQGKDVSNFINDYNDNAAGSQQQNRTTNTGNKPKRIY